MCQLKAPATLPPGKTLLVERPYQYEEGCVSAGLNDREQGKTSCPFRDLKHESPVLHLVDWSQFSLSYPGFKV